MLIGKSVWWVPEMADKVNVVSPVETETKRPFQYSLRTLLIIMLVLSLLFIGIGYIVRENIREAEMRRLRQTTMAYYLPDSAKRVKNIQDALDKVFTDSASVRFLSWNGQWGGLHDDTYIELNSDGTTEVTEITDVVVSHYGTYSIKDAADGKTSELTISLKQYKSSRDFRTKLPVMAVYTDQSELLLLPVQGFVLREYEYYDSGDTYWLFRQKPIPQKTK